MTDVSGTARKLADKSTAQVREGFERSAAAGQEATRRFETAASKATQGVREFQRKLLEITRANVEAAFDCAQKLLDVQSPSEFVEVTATHARERVAAMSEQTRELAELAQNMARHSFEPMSERSSVSRAMS